MNNKNLIFVAITVAVALGVGIFWFTKEKASQETSDAENARDVARNNKEMPTASESEDADLSSWETYRNDKYGFEFKYPKDWKIEANSGINSDRSVVSLTSPKTAEMLQKSEYCEGCGSDISFYYYSSILNEPSNESIKAKTLGDFIEKEPYTKKLGTRMVGDMEMVEVTQGGFGSYYVLFVEKGGSIYKVFFTYADSKEKLGGIENKIISTFKVR